MTQSDIIARIVLDGEITSGPIHFSHYDIFIEEIANGHRLIVTRDGIAQSMDILNGAEGPRGVRGETGATGAQGPQGETGPKGADGFSPSITVTEITGGHRITVINKDTSTSFDMLNGKNTFIATYDSTSYNEIVTAFNQGKQCYLVYDVDQKIIARLTDITSSVIIFSATIENRVESFYINSQNRWSKDIYRLETKAYKVNAITNASTDDQYASARAIYNLVAAMGQQKQDTISNLNEITAGAAAGATALQPKDVAAVALSGSYNDLKDKPSTPEQVTEQTVAGWGFTKNTGNYSKPSGGIPKTDLAEIVQESLSKADSALQSIELDTTLEQSGVAADAKAVGDAITEETTARENANITLQEQIDALISRSDVVDVVGTYAELQAYDTSSLGNNDVVKVLTDSTHSNGRSYYRWVISNGSGEWVYVGSEAAGYTKAEADTLLNAKQNTISDLDTIRSGASAGATAYQKPSNGVPKADLAASVQTSLGKADSALQGTDTTLSVSGQAADAQVVGNQMTLVARAGLMVVEPTPFATIRAAFNSGRAVLLKYTDGTPTQLKNTMLTLNSCNSSEAIFTTTIDNTVKIITIYSDEDVGIETVTIPQVDTTLAVSGQAADAKATGDALNGKATEAYVNQQISTAIADVDTLLGSGVIE